MLNINNNGNVSPIIDPKLSGVQGIHMGERDPIQEIAAPVLKDLQQASVEAQEKIEKSVARKFNFSVASLSHEKLASVEKTSLERQSDRSQIEPVFMSKKDLERLSAGEKGPVTISTLENAQHPLSEMVHVGIREGGQARFNPEHHEKIKERLDKGHPIILHMDGKKRNLDPKMVGKALSDEESAYWKQATQKAVSDHMEARAAGRKRNEKAEGRGAVKEGGIHQNPKIREGDASARLLRDMANQKTVAAVGFAQQLQRNAQKDAIVRELQEKFQEIRKEHREIRQEQIQEGVLHEGIQKEGIQTDRVKRSLVDQNAQIKEVYSTVKSSSEFSTGGNGHTSIRATVFRKGKDEYVVHDSTTSVLRDPKKVGSETVE